MTTLLLLLAFAYVCGSVPTGVWLSRLRGVDPRDVGSGNIGATNVSRAAGPALGALTFCGDTLKGWLPVMLAARAGYAEPALALTGLAAFTGHLYSCLLRFEGGKGVATAFGVVLALAPGAAAVILPIFALSCAVFRYVSLASILAAASTPPTLIALGYGPASVVVSITMAVLIALRHRDNIRRIRFGTESRIGAARSSPADSGVA